MVSAQSEEVHRFLVAEQEHQSALPASTAVTVKHDGSFHKHRSLKSRSWVALSFLITMTSSLGTVHG